MSVIAGHRDTHFRALADGRLALQANGAGGTNVLVDGDGAGGAAPVLVVAVVRDRFEGAARAQTMSLVMIVFMIVPVLAPAFGQAVLAVGTWRHIFIGLAAYGLLLALWGGLRLPETLAAGARRPLSGASVGAAALETLRTRASIGNTLAATLAFGSPNACTICHTDRTASWADEQVRSWHERDYQAPVLRRAGWIAAARKGDWSMLGEMLAYLASEEREEIWSTSLLRLLRG